MEYNILEYGALSGGEANCTEAIQSALDDCAKSGGRVIIPAGIFLSGPLQIGSETELYLEQGAVLRADINPEEEMISQEVHGGDTVEEWQKNCFLLAKHQKNITISGQGTIDGQGRRVFYDDNSDEGFHECPLRVNGFRRRTTYLEDVENLTVRDVTFYDAAFWTLHMAGCENVLVENVRILNNDRGPNNDGIDPDCCKNVVIRGCIIETGDDSIVIKSTHAMYERYGDCENIIIQGCILHSRDSGMKIGSETWGSIRNVVLSDCIMRSCTRAIGIWVRDGGTVEDIWIHHVTGNTIRYADAVGGPGNPRWWGKGEPFFLSSVKRSGSENLPGTIKNITFENIRLTAESSIFLGGEEDAPIENVRMLDVEITWRQQGKHRPCIFDEQPSQWDVYEHEIPCVYGRKVHGFLFRGCFTVEESLSDVIVRRDILENCRDCELDVCMQVKTGGLMS